MHRPLHPQCPNCTYPLEGLRAQRCPECGFELHALLFERPELARPRPAWERRPQTTFLHALWRTLVDVTIRPRRFFASIQHPDRLDRAIKWFVLLCVLALVLNCGATFVRQWYSGRGPATFGIDTIAYYLWALSSSTKLLLQGMLIVGAPVFVMLVAADLLLWRDRQCFRLFVKGALFALTIHLWTLIVVAITWQVLSECRKRGLLGVRSQLDIPPWINWTIVVFATWYFGVLYHGLLCKDFAALQPARRLRRAQLGLLVIAGWVFAVYLTLFDNYFGFRFPPVWWSQLVW